MRALRVIRERRAVARAHRAIDAVVATHLAQRPSACSAGCSYCCHVNVDVTRAEVLAIAERVRDRADLIQTLAQRTPMTDDERWRAKVPCALLDDTGHCSVYDLRPLRCRAFHSYSLAACRDAFAGGDPELPIDANLERACDAVDLPGERLTLEPALLEALR